MRTPPPRGGARVGDPGDTLPGGALPGTLGGLPFPNGFTGTARRQYQVFQSGGEGGPSGLLLPSRTCQPLPMTNLKPRITSSGAAGVVWKQQLPRSSKK